jgi:NAD+ synthase (glutamine-hydrolysing)
MQDKGFLRVALLSPTLKPADVSYNLEQAERKILAAAEEKAGLIVLPELCLTGVTIGDLFRQNQLYQAQLEAARKLVELTASIPSALVFGFYVRHRQRLYNCAGLAKGGHLFGVVPQAAPAAEGLERWFDPAPTGSESAPGTTNALTGVDQLCIDGLRAPFGDLLFQDDENEVSLSLRIGQDLFLPAAAEASGLLTLCPAAFKQLVGSPAFRRNQCLAFSQTAVTACCIASAGAEESTGRAVYSGHCLVAERGRLIAETEPLTAGSTIAYGDIDVSGLLYERMTSSLFRDASALAAKRGQTNGRATVTLSPLYMLPHSALLKRTFPTRPFVPDNESERRSNCREAFAIQVHGLMGRLARTGSKKIVIGVSGGLDSTLALLVAAAALKLTGRPADDLMAVTMPGFGTTDHTRQNALILMRLLGTDCREISIEASVTQHFKDIGHDINDHNFVYENAQARERTQILMDLANRENGLQIGTGDLSENALGWSTYNGDHMAMFNVNAGNPKTFIQAQLQWLIDGGLQEALPGLAFSLNDEELTQTLTSILETPVSPELLPPDLDGQIQQKTEDKIGPYILHDFFIYHTLRDGWSPTRMLRVAAQAFGGEFSSREILHWLTDFYRRFITQQFKRNCSPDHARIGTVDLSPRDGFIMPGDIAPTLWLNELNALAELLEGSQSL